MSPKKKVKPIPKEPQFCKLCAHVSNPRNLSVTGEPTLGTCPYEEVCYPLSKGMCKRTL